MSVARRKNIVTVCIVDFLAVALAFLLRPVTRIMFDSLPDCVFARMGFLCPSCGGTRCINQLSRGRLVEAFMYNPCVFLMVVYMLLILVVANLGYLFNVSMARKIFKAITNYKVIITIAVCYAVFGIIRNIF